MPIDRSGDSIVKSPEFYFSDGSVVVILDSTAFRVHKSVLGRHSDVFSGMWDVPQPSLEDTYDDCPVVYLQDSSEDFENVLSVLYDAFYFDRIRPDTSLSNLITYLAGILRISTKYGMHKLRNKCIAIIEDKFPSTLSGCDEVLSKGLKYTPSEIVRIIPLARETTLPKVLPWAFYLCAHISAGELLSNDVLSWRDKALCLAGKEKLWELQKKLTHSFMLDFKQHSSCTQNCQARNHRDLKLENVEDLRLNPHPLEEYTDWKTLMLCPKCQQVTEFQHKEGRDKVWQMLPKLFDLGETWEEICRDQNGGE